VPRDGDVVRSRAFAGVARGHLDGLESLDGEAGLHGRPQPPSRPPTPPPGFHTGVEGDRVDRPCSPAQAVDPPAHHLSGPRGAPWDPPGRLLGASWEPPGSPLAPDMVNPAGAGLN